MFTREAAKYLGISYYYLRNLRHEGLGPNCSPADTPRGPGWFYVKDDLDAWIASRGQGRPYKHGDNALQLVKARYNRGDRVADISENTGIPRSSVYKLLKKAA
jgi:hypothetical protein